MSRILFFTVFFCSTIISGGISLNEETSELNLTKASQVLEVSRWQIPNFPEYNHKDRVLVSTNDGKILSCGGKSKICYVLTKGTWVQHSILNTERNGAVAIQMVDGIYIFGGHSSPNTSEFLPNNATVWQKGPCVPYTCGSFTSSFLGSLAKFKTLPYHCCYKAKGHAISNTELILIKEDHIIKYNTVTKVWSGFCKLKVRRQNFASAILEGKLVITGGTDCSNPIPGQKQLSYDLTEIVDLSSKTSRIASNLKTSRQNHGMSIMKIGIEFKLVAFGGESEEDSGLLDSIEVWDGQSETWKVSELKLQEKSSRFSAINVFNRLSSEDLIPVQVETVSEDDSKPVAPSDIFHAVPKTRQETERWYFHSLHWYKSWLLSTYLIALLPFPLWIATISYLSIEILMHTAHLSVMDFRDLVVFEKPSMDFWKYPIFVIPQKITSFSEQCLKIIRWCEHEPDLTIGFLFILTFISDWAVPIYYEIILEHYYMDSKSEKDVDDYRVICELRDTATLRATQLMILLSYERIASKLKNINKSFVKSSCKEQISKLITHPILTLTYIFLTLYFETLTKIALYIWIVYSVGIVMKDMVFSLSSNFVMGSFFTLLYYLFYHIYAFFFLSRSSLLAISFLTFYCHERLYVPTT